MRLGLKLLIFNLIIELQWRLPIAFDNKSAMLANYLSVFLRFFYTHIHIESKTILTCDILISNFHRL